MIDQQNIPPANNPVSQVAGPTPNNFVAPEASSSFSPPPEPLYSPPSSVPPSPGTVNVSSFSTFSRIKPVLTILAAVLLFAAAGFIIYNFVLKKNLGKPKVTLIYWGLFEPAAVYTQVFADFEKIHPNIKVDYAPQSLKDYRERLQAALERKEGPDIFRIHQSWVPMFGSSLSPVPSTVYDASAFEQTFYPSAKESLKYQSQYVAIPLMYDGLALFYNEDLFKAAGKIPPKNWVELKKLACELTVMDENGKIKTAGVALGTTTNVDHWSDILGLMMIQNGVDLANPSLCTKEGEEEVCLGRDALSYYALFAIPQACAGENVDVGAVWGGAEEMPSSTYTFATGNLAMYFGPSWRVFDIKAKNQSLNFKIVPVPQLPDQPVDKNISWSTYWVEAVSKKSSYQKEAWELLSYLSSKEVQQKLYQVESNLRLFGEISPRVDSSSLLKDQPYVGAFIEQAAYSKNWYLSSNTGDNGINDKIIKYYEDAVNSVGSGGDALQVLTTVTKGVAQVLRQYGISK